MISILIPTYNYNVENLIRALHKQLMDVKLQFEVICLDDASPQPKNSEHDFKDLQYVVFNSLQDNLGRSKIRNRLAEIAKYENLIFLDCDTLPAQNDFILKYVNALKEHTIVFGGLNYKPNLDENKSLRYRYGLQRESISIDERLGAKKNHFTTANFAIKKKIFESIKFDESHINYGHEDTLFSIETLKNGHKINQINNPVYHLQLDTNAEYITKTESSLRNLLMYYNLKKIKSEDVKPLKYYELIYNLRLRPLFAFLFKTTKPTILKNLYSSNPKLWIFDCYRFGYLCTLKEQND